MGDRFGQAGKQADMRSEDGMAKRRASRSAGVLGPTPLIFRIAFEGLADIVTEPAGDQDVAVNFGFREGLGEVIGETQRQKRDAAQMKVLPAALEDQRARHRLAGHVADTAKTRLSERKNPGFCRLIAQFGLLYQSKFRKVLKDARA